MDIGIPVPNITQPATPEAIRLDRQVRPTSLDFTRSGSGITLFARLGRTFWTTSRDNDRYTWDLYEPTVTAGLVAGVTEQREDRFRCPRSSLPQPHNHCESHSVLGPAF